MSNHFIAHQNLIEELAPIVNQPEFGGLLRQRTKGLDEEKRFLLKMEIKRLAKPCMRSIDLRIMVDEECRLIEHQGIQHYLHDHGVASFRSLIEQYGDYTFGVYESLIRSVETLKHDSKQLVSLNTEDQKQSTNWQKYLVPYNDLMFYHHRRDERMNYVVELQIIVSADQRINASSVDISHRGLRVKLENSSDLKLLKSFRPVMIVFTGFNHSSGLTKEPIEYKVVRITGDDQQARVHLSRDWQLGPKVFNEYLSKTIQTNKRRYKLNLDNTIKALECKVFEQAFASNSPSLSLFVNSEIPVKPFAEFTCVNSVNSEILDYWLNEEKQQQIGFLLNSQRLLTLASDSRVSPSIVIYSFNHISQSKVYFYSATEQELAEHPELVDVFFSYASRKVSWRVYHISLSELDPEQAYLPSSLPNDVNKNIDKMNVPLSPRLVSKLQHLSHLVTVTDITHAAGQQCYQKRPLDKDKIKELAKFGHPHNKPPKPVQVFRYTQQDKRRHTRYQLRTPLIVSNGSVDAKGFTEDISVTGVRLEMNDAFDTKVNAKLSLNLYEFQEKTDEFDLSKLRYRVKHLSDDLKVLHLEAISDEDLSTAELFFSRLIHNNKDKLGVLSNEESIPGMGIALRNLQSKHTPQLCTYMQRTAIGYVPIKATTCDITANCFALMRHQVPLTNLNFSWLFQDRKTKQAFVQHALRTLKFEQGPIVNEIFVAFDSNEKDPERCAQTRWEYELDNHKQRYKFIKDTIVKREFIAFRITVNSASRPETALLNSELEYLSQYAIHKAKEIEELMWDISGEIYITDITQEVLLRYGLRDLQT